MTRVQLFILSAVCVLGMSDLPIHSLATAQSMPSHTMVSASELKWVDVPSLPPGAKIAVLEGPMNEAVPFTARIRVPANYQIPAHWHPAVERVSVLSGTLYMGLGDVVDVSKGMALRAGGFAVMQIKAPHFVYTTNEPVELQLHGIGPWGIIYINPADDPRNKQP